MKRFMLFCMERYEEGGGMNDFIGDFNTRKEMINLIINQDVYVLYQSHYWQIFDIKEKNIIIDGCWLMQWGDPKNGFIMLDMEELDELDNKMKITKKDWK